MPFTKKSTKELVQGQPEVKKEKPVKRWKIGSGGQPKEKKERSPDGRTPIFRTKLFWGAVSISLGLLIAFAGIPMLKMAVTETEPTVRFAQDVKAGTKVTEDLLTVVDMSPYHLPSDTLHEKQAAVGRYVKTDAVAGDLATASRFSEGYPGADPQMVGLPEDTVVISISLPDLSQSVSGKLRQGDIVQIFAVEDNNSFRAAAPPELQYVEVLAASYADGSDVQETQDTAVDNTAKDGALSTVTLLANAEQAACLAGLNQNAKLHAALVIRGDDAAKARALEAQADYFAKLEDSEVPEEAAGTETAADALPASGQNG
ncbi:Flp pilus assembly protein CpaB [uncultured Oscillibacter sp.]|uniref:Flp pilus assembly protein CpaB n=1 Tax=uncultured Oscillibacter sp. TaxID=876091 RepID=UPI0025F46D19|nr:RcpC/CpaB family pilus assembly protein [uncultured Oscillibacter sp.]